MIKILEQTLQKGNFKKFNLLHKSDMKTITKNYVSISGRVKFTLLWQRLKWKHVLCFSKVKKKKKKKFFLIHQMRQSMR